MGQYGTGLGGPDKTRLSGQYETRLGGPVRNWVGGPDKIGLDGLVRNSAWWASTKLGLEDI